MLRRAFRFSHAAAILLAEAMRKGSSCQRSAVGHQPGLKLIAEC